MEPKIAKSLMRRQVLGFRAKGVRTACALALCGSLSAPGAAVAESPSLNMPLDELITNCRFSAGGPFLFCIGYIRGTLEGLSEGTDAASSLCLPAFRPGERRKIFMAWLDTNKKDRPRLASTAIIKAFQEKFPCPAKP